MAGVAEAIVGEVGGDLGGALHALVVEGSALHHPKGGEVVGLPVELPLHLAGGFELVQQHLHLGGGVILLIVVVEVGVLLLLHQPQAVLHPRHTAVGAALLPLQIVQRQHPRTCCGHPGAVTVCGAYIVQ